MANIIEVTDLNAPELAAYTRLTEAQLRARQGNKDALFIAESHKVIAHALDAGYEPVSMLMEQAHITGTGRELIKRCPNLPIYTAERALLARLTGYELTRGFLCAMRRPPLPTLEAVCRDARRIAVLENIVDPTNVGAAVRCAAALGFDAVLLSPSCCDPLHRRAVRVSMGTIFQIPWTRFEGTAAAWPGSGLDALRALGFKTAALALTDKSLDIDDPAPAKENRLAVILGTEGDGLMRETIALCDYTLRIPMAHGVDSLNVAAAAAVAFWQLRRRDA